MRNHTCAVAAFALLVGCGTDVFTEGDFSHELHWHQDPGEIQDCHIFKLENADPIEVDRITVKFPEGSHHVHIYRSDTPEPDGVVDCRQGIDWLRWHLVLGVQTQPMDWQLPSGLTVPLAAHQQLLVQVHWLNTTEAPVDPEIDISFHTIAVAQAHVGVMFGVDKQTAMQPFEHKVLHQWCAMPEGAELVAVMGHYHGLGQRFTVDARTANGPPGDVIYDALDDQTFEFKLYDPAYLLHGGRGLEFECDYFNYRPIPITWGPDTKTQEHCNLVAYYYPAEILSQFCITEAAEVSAIAGPSARVLPGDDATFTIDLSEAAADDGANVRLASSDPTALVVPETVYVAPGATSAMFQAKALRPARVTVTATLGSLAKSATAKINGLALSEIYVSMPGTTDRHQWVELSNLSSVAIDLSQYSLGAGASDYTKTRAPLHVVLPPNGCVVVGGPLPTTTQQPPYDEAFDFAPDLAPGGTAGNGVALFDIPADQITASTIPLDALVYGATNNSLLDPSGNIAQPMTLAPPGGSYFRAVTSHWQTQPVATPRICEVH